MPDDDNHSWYRDALTQFGGGFNRGLDGMVNLPGAAMNLGANALGYDAPFQPLRVATRANAYLGDPTTTAGRYAGMVGEQVGASALPEAGLASRGMNALARSGPFVASNVGAGVGTQAARDADLGPYAEMFAGLAGGIAAPVAAHYAGPALDVYKRYMAAAADPSSVGIFGGNLAAGADKAKLARAQSMKDAGAPRDDIWKNTGWFEGVDGKWRFEIPDDTAKWIGPKAENVTGMHSSTVAGLIDHPALYNAYPDWAERGAGYDRTDILDHIGGQNTNGLYAPKIDAMVLRARNDVNPLSVGLHESQHAIQAREGFARGADPSSFTLGDLDAERTRLSSLASREKPSWTQTGTSHAEMTDREIAHLLYLRSAGEVEARNVQSRLAMTPEQRRATPPWHTQDVPDEQQIVRSSNQNALNASHSDSPEIQLYAKNVGVKPPETYPRPFTKDYENANVNNGEALPVDMEGRPLNAKYVAGRRVGEGADTPIRPEEFVPLSRDLFSFEPIPLPAKEMPSGKVGIINYGSGLPGPSRGKAPDSITYSSALTPRQKEVVLPHEIGHGIEGLIGQIKTDGLMSELKPMYDTLWTGEVRDGRKLTEPKHLGYSPSEVPREHMAEAIRAYLTDPNYIKTVAPKTAAAIRAAVNSNPRLNKTIQFNSLFAPFSAAGLGSLGASYFQDGHDR